MSAFVISSEHKQRFGMQYFQCPYVQNALQQKIQNYVHYVVDKGQVTNRFCTGLYGIISTAIWETLNLNRILVPHSVLKLHSIYEIIAMAQKNFWIAHG